MATNRVNLISDIISRLEALEERELTVKDLPYKQLKDKLEDDFQPNADTFLLPGSVGPEALSPELMQGRICTSTTRPAEPYEGLTIYETDTGNTRTWDGAAWQPQTP